MEIGVGLESVDDFVRETCINKGFTIEDFEKALDIISSLDAQHPRRVALVVYLIVKPPFLTQKECIEDVVASLKYLYSVSDRYQFRIVPKLEPAAIADGTVLSMLHRAQDSMFYYEPLNYWAVLEIIARAACEMGEGGFEIRVGAREDMDDVVKAPAVYNKDGETFHPFDFVIYESIQKFNQHQNYSRLFAVVGEVYRVFNGIPLTDKTSSLMQWLEANKFENSATEEFIRVNAGSIKEQAERQETKRDIEMMVNIYRVLDILEGITSETLELKASINEAIIEKDDASLESRIAECFEKVAPRAIVRVSLAEKPKIIGNYAEVFFDVTDLLRAEKTSVWSRFSVPMLESDREKESNQKK